ncbi:carboxymuconolactone decarboxylase family protein [Vibrio rhizosphaerae]|uniref:Carboxymuconolactone decarboxylase family protein n=1 Tax=Vibrio rhizosphaerae TaxID=398736 RepID=A0ABU4IYW9_9VIBR|nr:carboxymuconolactone decarboxylase family protein [Vibrio rhizosphaerae]MDW6093423.1 carboxymuconolactone decarboxylase family protein [Vibrio rhizosphaerae]
MISHDKNKDLIERFDVGATEWGKENFRPVFPDLVDHLIDDIYGFAYRREVIDIKTRHLISIGILSAMGGCENQLEFQLKAALNLGLTEEEVKEAFIQVAVFSGNARAINAARIFHDKVLEKQVDNDK